MAKPKFKNIKQHERSNCDRYLTETDQRIVRKMLTVDDYGAAFDYIFDHTAAPHYSEDHLIRELQEFYGGSLLNVFDPEQQTFYPKMG